MTTGLLTGYVLEEQPTFSLGELCRVCGVHAEWVAALVEEGVLEPRGRAMSRWRFPGASVQRVQAVLRLQRDLDINLAGAALALELMEEVRVLRARLLALEYMARRKENLL